MQHFDLKMLGLFGMLILLAVAAEVASAWTKPLASSQVISDTHQP